MAIQKFHSAKWASEKEGLLESFSGKFPVQMSDSNGTALPLLLDDSGEKNFGADLIHFEAGQGVALHQHEGSHILLVTQGTGILTYRNNENDEKYDMFPGMIYLIPSSTAHAIEATTELVLVAIGNDHRSADSEERLDLVI